MKSRIETYLLHLDKTFCFDHFFLGPSQTQPTFCRRAEKNATCVLQRDVLHEPNEEIHCYMGEFVSHESMGDALLVGLQMSLQFVLEEVGVKEEDLTSVLCKKKFNSPKTYYEITAAVLASIGFHLILQLGEVKGYFALLSALVERWRPKTHMFHFPVREMIVTLKDMIHILGLPINGDPVTGIIDSNHSFLVENFLAVFGRQPSLYDHTLRKVNLAWVR
ncbi:hypothetical protein Ahy_B03g066749 [Arachis hypogaea]|uniref:Aminotransferase-like plant mobile domain-containing protein n=1 Tax=Arachis hypogaea TaxID=3818 RepID=A0A445A4S7_ARAHY|nr:hypothetical protein Ahy_B03g066749 [Arachis hypogaea]